MEAVFEKLTEYTLALKEALANTHQANERPLITGRLAAAAEMFALLHKSGEVSVIRGLVLSEIGAHGWSFIAGTTGEDIAAKWAAFTEEAGIKWENT